MSDAINTQSIASEIDKAKQYAAYFGLPYISLKDKKVDLEAVKTIPDDVMQQYKIIVYEKTAGAPPTLKIAVAEPQRLKEKAPQMLSRLKKEKGVNFSLAIITKSDFDYFFNQYKKPPITPTALQPKPTFLGEKIEEKPEAVFAQTPNYPVVILRSLNIPYSVLNKFPEEVASKYKMIVFESDEKAGKIKVALVNPDDPQAQEILDFIEERNKLQVEKYKTTQADFLWAIKLYQSKSSATTQSTPISRQQPPSVIKKEFTSKPETKNIPAHPIEDREERIQISRTAPTVKSEEVATEKPATGEVEEESSSATITLNEQQNEETNLDTIFPNGIKNTDDLVKIVKTGFVPKIVAAILYLAIKSEASDIHLEASAKDFRLRYRIDGVLQDILTMPITLHPPIISRIKILARLKIDEQRVPQDGRFDVIVNKREVDLRISTLPTVHGEKVVMRILDKSSAILSLDKLGFTGTNLKRVEDNIHKPYGIILATGPTGSGKSTTLYAVLGEISVPGVNVVTLEDPVEYEIPGINQCQIRPKIGFGFADGLRSILRQDPNIIMVGEIRDSETANLATHAALTGHLVLSTLHTNDAAGALPRLINMGVEPFLITSSINAIIAQ
ncbi:MAG: type II/IV secretion system protein, partial [Patescibacteria group bacterium]|nr:type II/IV secretion system protein [Patescibacteria group bacterium]